MTATDRAREFLIGLLQRMGVEADVEVLEEAERIVFDVKGPEAGLIIGKKGQTLDALQYLVAKVAYRSVLSSEGTVVHGEAAGTGADGGTETGHGGQAGAGTEAGGGEGGFFGKPMIVDAEGYRARRLESLVEMAHHLGEKAIRSGKTITVSPMSPHDRRIVHITLDKVPGVTTRSEGEGAFRRLLIIPQPDKQ